MQFWVNKCFLSALEKCHTIPSLPPWLLMRNLLSFKLFFPSGQSILFLSTFKIFFLCFQFSEVWLWCVSVWISLDLPCLEFSQLFESVCLCLGILFALRRNRKTCVYLIFPDAEIHLFLYLFIYSLFTLCFFNKL